MVIYCVTMKKCPVCHQVKPESEFNKNRARGDGLQCRCRSCDRIRSLRLYHSDPHGAEKACARKKKSVIRNRMFVIDYLKSHPCIQCGEKDILVLEFDHRSQIDKTLNIAQAIYSGWTTAKVQNEISKCDVLCANCHKRKTARQLGWYKFGLVA